MGMVMSLMGLGGGLPSSQMLSFVLGTVYKQFIERNINNFEEFHVAILDIFNTFNSALPGKHYDVPSCKEVETVFAHWKDAKEPKKKEIFIEFMKKNVNLSKVDNTTMITGIVTPPVAMAAKKAGENVPQLKMIKAIPDVLFVPSATVLALISVKISRRIFMEKVGVVKVPPSGGPKPPNGGPKPAVPYPAKGGDLQYSESMYFPSSTRWDPQLPTGMKTFEPSSS